MSVTLAFSVMGLLFLAPALCLGLTVGMEDEPPAWMKIWAVIFTVLFSLSFLSALWVGVLS
jgi:hypothetical protein